MQKEDPSSSASTTVTIGCQINNANACLKKDFFVCFLLFCEVTTMDGIICHYKNALHIFNTSGSMKKALTLTTTQLQEQL